MDMENGILKMENNTKIENNMGNSRTLTEIVEAYKNSTNPDIKNDFFKCCSYLSKHQEEVTIEEYLGLVEMVYKHYIKQVTKDKLPFKTYIQSDWKIVKPFKEELAKLEENNGNPTNIDYSSIIGKYDPYTEVNMVYLVELFKYRYNKKNCIKNKYLTTATETETVPNIAEVDLQYYIEQVQNARTFDELLEVYSSTVAEVVTRLRDNYQEEKAKAEKQFIRYKQHFNKALHKFEAAMQFKNRYYTSTNSLRECVYSMLLEAYRENMLIDAATVLVDDIFDVINYRMKTFRATQAECANCIAIVNNFQELIVKNLMTPSEAAQFTVSPNYRAQYIKAMDEEIASYQTE